MALMPTWANLGSKGFRWLGFALVCYVLFGVYGGVLAGQGEFRVQSFIFGLFRVLDMLKGAGPAAFSAKQALAVLLG